MSAAFSPDSNFLTMPFRRPLSDWPGDDDVTRPAKTFRPEMTISV
jgi:hypothetical protein